MDLAQLQKQFGLRDEGLKDIKGTGGKFGTTDTSGQYRGHKYAKGKGNPYAGVYNDAKTGAIYGLDGKYLGSISTEAGMKNKAINEAWTGMGEVRGEQNIAFDDEGEGNVLNTHHNIAEAIQSAYGEGTKEAEPQQLSQRAAEAVAGTETYTDARRSGLLSDMRFGSDDTTAADASQTFKDNFSTNLKKRLEPDGGLGAGFAGAGPAPSEFERETASMREVRKGRKAGDKLM